MKQKERRNSADKKSKSSSPKVRSFVKPFLKEQSVRNENACNIYYDNIGNDVFLSDTDPYGSYTGITRGEDDRPVQDADDL